jgi:hypothetical protein
VKPGREDAVRAYGKAIEDGIRDNPTLLAPLTLHFLRWIQFTIGGDLYFMYQGIFDTDFDKYTETTRRSPPGAARRTHSSASRPT